MRSGQTHHLQDCAREKVVLTHTLNARVSFNDFQDVLYDVHVCTCPPRSGMSLIETCVRTVGLAVSEVNRLGERHLHAFHTKTRHAQLTMHVHMMCRHKCAHTPHVHSRMYYTS